MSGATVGSFFSQQYGEQTRLKCCFITWAENWKCQLYSNCLFFPQIVLFCITSDGAFCFDRGSSSAIVKDNNAITRSSCIKLWLFLVNRVCYVSWCWIQIVLEAHYTHTVHCKDILINFGVGWCPQNHNYVPQFTGYVYWTQLWMKTCMPEGDRILMRESGILIS